VTHDRVAYLHYKWENTVVPVTRNMLIRCLWRKRMQNWTPIYFNTPFSLCLSDKILPRTRLLRSQVCGWVRVRGWGRLRVMVWVWVGGFGCHGHLCSSHTFIDTFTYTHSLTRTLIRRATAHESWSCHVPNIHSHPSVYLTAQISQCIRVLQNQTFV